MKSQEYMLLDSIMIDGVTLIESDKAGNLYVALDNGDIVKYNGHEEIGRLSTPLNSEMASMEPGVGLKLFVFYKDLQQYLLANRTLTQYELYRLPRELYNFASNATFSADQNIWITDPIDLDIKKLGVMNNLLITRSSAESIEIEDWSGIFMIKEHDSFLFVADLSRGVHLFDNFGNYVKFIPIDGLNNFDLQGSLVITVSELGNFTRTNFYTGEEIKMEFPYPIVNVNELISFSITDPFLFIAKKNKIFIMKKAKK